MKSHEHDPLLAERLLEYLRDPRPFTAFHLGVMATLCGEDLDGNPWTPRSAVDATLWNMRESLTPDEAAAGDRLIDELWPENAGATA